MLCGDGFAGELLWEEGPVERGRSGTEADAVGVILIRFPSGCCELCVADAEMSFGAPSWVGSDGDCAREGLEEVGGEPEDSPEEGPADATGFWSFASRLLRI